MFAGVAVNAAMVPVHAWLSDAYPEASVTGMEDRGEWKNSDEDTWEDEIIAAQREVVARLKKENN